MNCGNYRPALNRDDQIRLLRLARSALSHSLLNGKPMAREAMRDLAPGENCRRACNCFVSLHQGAQLRGCIGTIRADKPLFEAIAASAVNAGRSDPRFQPIALAELPQCDIEISVLSDFFPIAPEQIIIGRHGLLVESGPWRGLLLPQVAEQYNWNAAQFIAQTCRKAGLPPADPPADIQLSGFEAVVFSEKDFADAADWL